MYRRVNMNTNINMRARQPRALYLLVAVKMWECFSFYGMRALLVLYLISQLGFEDSNAYGVYAIYGSLFELGGILGGRFADKYLGLRKAVIVGGWVIAVGHICLSFHSQMWMFYAGLALIVVGAALFSANISALLGLFYSQNDPRREKGYTLFYVGINIGALLASALCGFVGEAYGWHYGFGLAALGMIAGNIMFLSCKRLLEGNGELMRKAPAAKEKFIGYSSLIVTLPICAMMIAWEAVFIQIQPFLCLLCAFYIGRKMWLSGYFSKDKLISLGVYLAALALFYAAEDLTASALLVFSERFATDTFAGFALPTASLLSLNPFVIIVGGLIMSKFTFSKHRSSWFVITGLLISSMVFLSLTFACYYPNDNAQVPLGLVAAAILFISMGEVFLGPAVFAYFSEASPKEWAGSTMGLLPVGFSLGNIISGLLSKSMAFGDTSGSASITAYGGGFCLMAVLLGLMALCIALINPITRSLSAARIWQKRTAEI